MRLHLPAMPSLPAVAMPRRVTLRWKLAGLLIFIAALVVALTLVSLASLAKVSDGGRRNVTQVTQPLAALGSARALVNENAGLADRHILEGTLETKRPLEQRILANDRRIARALAAAAPTFTTAQERKRARFLEHNLATYRSVTSELFGVSRANTPELAYEWSSQRLDPAADTLSSRPREPLRRQGGRGRCARPRGDRTPSTARAGSCCSCSPSSSSSPSRPAWSPSAASASASRPSSRA